MLRPQRPVVLLLLLLMLGLAAWWVHDHQCKKWRSCQVSCRVGAIMKGVDEAARTGQLSATRNCDSYCAPEISWLPVGCP